MGDEQDEAQGEPQVDPRDTDPRDNAHWDAVEEGVELLREGDVAAAIEALSAVLAADSENKYACFYLGSAHFQNEALEKSLKAYLRALELSPEYLGAMVGAGHTLRMMGRLDQSIRMARQALARSKEDPDALYLLGLVHFQRGDRARALEVFDQFLATRPEVEVGLEVQGLMDVLRGKVVPVPEEEDE